MKLLHDINFILPIAIGLFWAIVFLQSGIDKLLDFSGNLAWLKDHFSKVFIGKMIKPALAFLCLIELAAGTISLIGVLLFIINGHQFWIIQGIILSMLALLMLFFGQRLAKDYEGAKTIAIYFGVAILSCLALA
jgi:hypothetical protein